MGDLKCNADEPCLNLCEAPPKVNKALSSLVQKKLLPNSSCSEGEERTLQAGDGGNIYVEWVRDGGWREGLTNVNYRIDIEGRLISRECSKKIEKTIGRLCQSAVVPKLFNANWINEVSYIITGFKDPETGKPFDYRASALKPTI